MGSPVRDAELTDEDKIWELEMELHRLQGYLEVSEKLGRGHAKWSELREFILLNPKKAAEIIGIPKLAELDLDSTQEQSKSG